MNNDLLGEALKPIIKDAVTTELKALNIEEQVKESLTGIVQSASKTITVKVGKDGEPIKMGLVHEQFGDLLEVIGCGENVLLMGGAGRGKTTAIVKSAEALGLGFSAIAINGQTTKSDIIGFTDAMGVRRTTPVLDAMKEGKVLLIDEFDAGNENSMMILNGIVENHFIDIPEVGVIKAHENFRVVCSANTNLRGATSQYSARRKLDDATIDRFSIMEWGLDEELEKLITANDDWLTIVRAVRKTCDEQLDGLDITPRASYKGAKLLKTSLSLDKIIGMVLHKGLDADTKKVIDNAVISCKDEVKRLKARHGKTSEPKPKKVKTEPTIEVATEETPIVTPEPSGTSSEPSASTYEW